MIYIEFKGPPDPLRGDEIYRRVRECARVRTMLCLYTVSVLTVMMILILFIIML